MKNISRRSFVKSTAGFALILSGTGGISQLVSCKSAEEAARSSEKIPINPWVFLAENGTITIYNPAAEMGQGSMTALPLIFAEEMDADWGKVEVIFSPQNPTVYGSEGWSRNAKVQLTAGSRTVSGYYTMLRKAGAQTRKILLNSAAKLWNLSADELHTENGRVLHADSRQSILYGDLVKHLVIPEEMPEISPEDLKSPIDFKLIGKDIPRTDIAEKVNGNALFASDLRFPEMVYGVIERGKVHGAAPILNNQDQIQEMEGFLHFVTLDYGIGIIANTLENVLNIKKELDISWEKSQASGFNSQEAYEKYALLLNQKTEGRVITNEGDFKRALKEGIKSYTADYKNDYVYHAQMEPVNAIAKVDKEGKSAEFWVGHQQGFNMHKTVGSAIGIDPDQIKINLYYLGGGFGRRSNMDFLIEAGKLAQAIPGTPLKLLWTREDDLQYGMYRPLSLQRLIATLDDEGNMSGLSHVIAGDGDRLLASGIKNEFYAIPNQYAELRIIPEGIRLKHWRGVGHGPNKFAIESMIDEVALDQSTDPLDFRRKLMKNAPRALATLEKAAEMADWNAPLPDNRAKGVAFLERSGTLSTGICEISVDQKTGKIRVHHFWSANDCGVVVQPDNAVAQMEGGIIMGISSVLKEQLTIKDGAVQQSNFNDYPLLRMEDVPDSIETTFIESDAPPMGVGESGTPLVAAAIANAFAALSGKRLRHLPFTPDRVLKMLQT